MNTNIYTKALSIVWIFLLSCCFLPNSGYSQLPLCSNCDDQNSCTVDFCFLGQCVHLPIPGCNRNPNGCDDGDPCTINTYNPVTRECETHWNPNCNVTYGNQCYLFPPKIRVICDDNRTLHDPSDDLFYFYIRATGRNHSDCFNITGDFNRTCLSYNRELGPFGPFPVSGGDLRINLLDRNSPHRNVRVVVKAPPGGCKTDHCAVRIEDVHVDPCTVHSAGGRTGAKVTAKVVWINAKNNVNLTINYQGATHSNNIIRFENVARNGSQTVSFIVPPNAIAGSKIKAEFSYPHTCRDEFTLGQPPSCAPPGPCKLTITKVEVGQCYFDQSSGKSLSRIRAFVKWENAPPNDVILLTTDGQTKELAASTANGEGFIDFVIPANGASNKLIWAKFKTKTDCADDRKYNAPPPCVPLPDCKLEITELW
ncbi:MAG TPA: hypothetical protein PKC76_04155, partial [Saprospiraceae bacterium]|nr:hypothetical protein [Saprospiraceae bacterium]HMP23296.1 hypothetical protein [Saprospiraceae bacterium]